MMDEFVLEIIAKRETGDGRRDEGETSDWKGERRSAGAWLFNIHRREASK